MAHSLSDLLDVLRLVSDWNPSHTWQINKGQIWTSVGVNVEHDWLVHDILFTTSDFISQTNNIVSNFSEAVELFAWYLFKYSPRFYICWLMVQSKF